jgi:hypothetical protein
VLAHIGWPAVALVVVFLISRVVKEKQSWWRLIFGIAFLLTLFMGMAVVSVRVLGMQIPGFNAPAMPRAPVPTATASPQPSVPVTARPLATANPGASVAYPGNGGREARSVQRTKRTAAPRATHPARLRSRSPTACVRASRPGGRRTQVGPHGTCGRCGQQLTGSLCYRNQVAELG